MVMTGEEFAGAFPAESDFVERKRGLSKRPLHEAIVAFSNADGGVILIGVDDNGQIVGRELTPGVEGDLHQALSEVRDPGRYEIGRLVVDGVEITVLSVARRVEGFAQTPNGRVLMRRGARNAALFGAELRRFLNDRALERFEESDSGVSLAEASETSMAELAQAYGWPHSDGYRDRLREHGLVNEDGRLTIAGALYLLDRPDSRLGKAYIEVLRFPEGARDYDRRIETQGPVHRQVEVATRLVGDELGSELVVLGLRRHQIPRLPQVVLREAVANAVAHRSYELSGSAIRIEIRPEAVRVISPGPLPEPVTEQNIRVAQAARNLHVIRVLRRLGLAEDAGRGVDVMEDAMREELLDPPRFQDTGHAVEVTLPIRSAVAPSERAWVREVERRGLIEARDRILLVHAARGEVLTNARVRELLGVDALQARDSLRRLRDTGFLIQRGRRGGATYVLDRDLAPPAGLHLPPEALEELLLEAAGEGPLTNAEVRLRTGLDRAEALRLLNGLVKAGRLVRLGERRGTKYVLPDQRS